MNHQGQVTVRFLQPIFDSELEASRPGIGVGGEGLGWERKAMARLVRRRMLLALKRAPVTAGAPLTRLQVFSLHHHDHLTHPIFTTHSYLNTRLHENHLSFPPPCPPPFFSLSRCTVLSVQSCH